MPVPAIKAGFSSFPDALEWAHKRGAILPGEFYSGLPASLRKQAFTVSGLTAVEQVQAVLDSLNGAIRDGASFAQWKAQAPADLGALPKGRRALIFRNFVQTNYGAGRAAQHERQKARRPFLMYDAINDGRTRPAHAAMDGHIAPHDDPIWNVWTPPCGHNCRCTVISLTEAQAQARGGPKQAPTRDANGNPISADPGWGSRPSTAQIDRMLDLEISRAKIEAPPKIDAAIDQAVARAAEQAAPKPIPVRVFGSPPAEWIATMEETIAKIPIVFQKTVGDFGYRIDLAEHLYDAAPEARKQWGRPRGWRGAGWGGVSGVAIPSERRMIAARTVIENRKKREEPIARARGTVIHEFGHALDFSLGRPSNAPEFLAAYRADAAEIRRDTFKRGRNSYYLQAGMAGPQEAFAEMFSQSLGEHAVQPLLQDWPNVAKYFEKLIAEAKQNE